MRGAQLVLQGSCGAAVRSRAALRSLTSLRFEANNLSYLRIAEPQGSRCYSVGSTSSAVARPVRDWGPVYPTSLQLRYQSTNVPQQSTSTTTPEPPLPVSSKGKAKVKVELRPGPAKPSTPSSPAAQQQQKVASKPSSQAPESISKPHPTKPPPASSAPESKKNEVLKEKESVSVIEMAKKDVEIAAQHGILAPPPPDAGFARKLFHQAKELFKFYWAGVKMIPANRKEVLKIQERIKSGGALLTWREHRFIKTNKSDMLKLVPFLLIVVVIEEIIPLIVMYAPGMLPSTCVLPSQRARIDAKRHERQREAYEIVKEFPVLEHDPEQVSFKSFNTGETKLLCKVMGLGMIGTHGTPGWRLRKHLRAIADEDAILLAEGKGARLKQAEIAEALWERGIVADSYNSVEQRNRLRWWLDAVKSASPKDAPEDVRVRLILKVLQQYK